MQCQMASSMAKLGVFFLFLHLMKSKWRGRIANELGVLVLVLMARASVAPSSTPPKECRPSLFEFSHLTGRQDICNATCREETHNALVEVYTVLSKDAAAGVLHLWPSEPACQACTLCRTDDKLCDPGPPYCCWRGVNCCRYFKRISPDTNCSLYSVVRLSLRTLGLNGSLDDALPALQTLHKWGLLYLELDGNELSGTIPSNISSLQKLRGLSLSNNGKCSFPAEE